MGPRRRTEDPMAPHLVLDTLMRLAAEQASRRNRKGQRRPRSVVAKTQATKRRKYRKRLLAAYRARRAARPRGTYRAAAQGDRLIDRMLAAMEPGRWYGRFDLVRAIGEGRPATAKVNQELLPRGWIERRRNPGYRGPYTTAECVSGVAEPPWLYRMTPRGELQREAVLLIGALKK